MTKDEALKQALEALEINLVFLKNVEPFKGQEDLASDCVSMTEETITAIEEALAHDDEDAIIIQYHEATIKILEKRIEELTAQPEQGPVAWEQFHEHLVERNFCPRCGKRTADLTTIHTCTPPQGNT